MNVTQLRAPATARDVLVCVKYERDVQLHTGSLPMNRADAERRIRYILSSVTRVPAGLAIREELDRIVRETFAEGKDVFPDDLLELSQSHRLFLLRTLAHRLTDRLEAHVHS